jgi:hypothetical protein
MQNEIDSQLRGWSRGARWLLLSTPAAREVGQDGLPRRCVGLRLTAAASESAVYFYSAGSAHVEPRRWQFHTRRVGQSPRAHAVAAAAHGHAVTCSGSATDAALNEGTGQGVHPRRQPTLSSACRLPSGERSRRWRYDD